jgi:hypothetical protein
METTGIIGYILFALSEILPLINVPTNGIIQTLLLGLGKAFKPPDKDIELAQKTVVKPEFTKLVNTIESNSQLSEIINHIINNSQYINILSNLINNNQLLNDFTQLANNNQLQQILNNLINNSQLYNNVFLIMNSPEQFDSYLQNKHLLNNILTKDYVLESLPFLTKQNTSIIQDINEFPQLVNLVKQIVHNEHKINILNILNTLLLNPDLISNINDLVNQAISNTVP